MAFKYYRKKGFRSFKKKKKVSFRKARSILRRIGYRM